MVLNIPLDKKMISNEHVLLYVAGQNKNKCP